MPRDVGQTKGNPLGRFFSGLWGIITWLRVALFNVIFLIIVIAIIAAVIQNQPAPLPDKFALRLAPSGQLVDQRQPIDPLTSLMDENAQYAETLVSDVVEAIDTAREDERVTHLVLELQYLEGGGLSKLEEIARALTQFRDSGKDITALSNNYNQAQYYLASFAHRVYVHDMGNVMITGFGSYRTYFKEALDKLAINFHVFRAGNYKDAVEPYTRNDMSSASKEHNSQWLNDLWQFYTARVEGERELESGSIDAIINRIDTAIAEADGNMSRLATTNGLVDAAHSRQQLRALLIDKFGYDEDADSYKAVDWQRYLGLNRTLPDLPGTDKVGVIVASGTILEGEHPAGTIGSDTMIQLLREARKNRDIKALVIRIDSGGGSAFASEVIRAEIATTRDTGIPVIISMGSVAASGGYWMAAGGDEIWALPTTITGSIGVYGLIPTLEESFDKLGLHNDGVGTTPLADAFHLDRPINPLMASAIQQNVDSLYRRFLQTVAQARGMTPEAVHEIAQGRVWSGQRAHQLGLVDKLGTLNDAVAAAAGFADLSDWETVTITRPLSPGEQLMQQLFGNSLMQGALEGKTANSLLRAQHLVAGITEPLDTLLQHPDSNRIYAHCLTCDMR